METTFRKDTVLERVCEVIWAVAIICLPITSFPLFESLSGGIVAPLSIIPFFILLLVWVVPMILRREELPKETIPLMAFSLATIISCAAALFLVIPGFKGKSVSGQEIRSLFTLAVGLTFYLVTTTWIKNSARLKKTWMYLTIGGMFMLLWAAIQAIFVLQQANTYPQWLSQIQSWLVVRSPSFNPKTGRVVGLAYEASWFAHQMVIVYLPIWIAATYYRTSAFRFRIYHISIENILLIVGLGAFFLSSPRIGLVSLLLVIIYLFMRLNLSLQHKLEGKISNSTMFRRVFKSDQRLSLARVITSILIIIAYILVLGGLIVFSVQRDWRLTALVSSPPTAKEIVGLITLDQATLLNLSNRFVFLERMVYWLNGWNVFNQYPWLGVGLGNAGFFFPKLAPALGWSSFEIRNVLYYLTQMPNVKSLWFRLLAETGLVGFSLFITWLFCLYQSSRFGQRHQDSTVKTLSFAGQLAFLALIGEGFSIDSFSMPYLWVMAGLVAGIAMMYRREILTRFSTN
jgi:O-Antigen ligase